MRRGRGRISPFSKAKQKRIWFWIDYRGMTGAEAAEKALEKFGIGVSPRGAQNIAQRVRQHRAAPSSVHRPGGN